MGFLGSCLRGFWCVGGEEMLRIVDEEAMGLRITLRGLSVKPSDRPWCLSLRPGLIYVLLVLVCKL